MKLGLYSITYLGLWYRGKELMLPEMVGRASLIVDANQGLAAMGNYAGQALSPFILVGLVLTGGRPGFILLGAWFALLGLAAPAIARWGERTRPAAPPPDADTAAATAIEQAAVAD